MFENFNFFRDEFLWFEFIKFGGEVELFCVILEDVFGVFGVVGLVLNFLGDECLGLCIFLFSLGLIGVNCVCIFFLKLGLNVEIVLDFCFIG